MMMSGTQKCFDVSERMMGSNGCRKTNRPRLQLKRDGRDRNMRRCMLLAFTATLEESDNGLWFSGAYI
jgi:hypothetical protein